MLSPRLRVSVCALLIVVCMAGVARMGVAAERPNVLVILTDDQGWGDLSMHGNTNLATPRIDSLARDGAEFLNFYVCPVCSPTRAEFLTGRYHPRGGVSSTSTGGERLDLDEETIAQLFQQAGYATGAFGKWHNGTQWPYHPNARGFDEYYGFCSGHWGHYFDAPLEHNGQPVRGRGFTADDFTDHAIAFLEAHRDEPFFCYLPFNTPHSPMQVPERFYEKFASTALKLRHEGKQEEDEAFTRAALAMCENLDWNIGRVLDKLDEWQLAERTIVVYFHDNGPNGWRWNGGLKGRKASTDEGGVRSPLFVRWPGKIERGVQFATPAAAIDLLPTLLDLAGIRERPAKPLDGVSQAERLMGRGVDATAQRLIFSHWAGKVSVRDEQFRLGDDGKLYNLTADPGQTRDVTQEYPERAVELKEAVAEWRDTVLGELATPDRRPFTVGYREALLTQLPARDGVAQGGITRSAWAPNCSFFTNWKSAEDRITWDIAVATAGRYEATLHYTCQTEDVGSTVELIFGDHRTAAKVTVAHDPPLEGAAVDRVPRQGESYVKEFVTLPLGTIELLADRGELTLRATEITGKNVADVRGISLKLVEE
ncbi:MAG: arylsulfatase [Pirellulales bacterium]|nr:arylsulfatase [Pirellulales bacterium]